MIVGGGFGGLYATRSLKDVDCDVVTLIDRRNVPFVSTPALSGRNRGSVPR